MSANAHHRGDVTVFDGYFQIDRPLDVETEDIMDALANGRCLARDVEKLAKALNMGVAECKRLYGQEGQYFLGEDETSVLPAKRNFFENNDFSGQPPHSCLRWEYHADDHTIRADDVEKHYCYQEWITLLVEDVLAPRGYVVNGTVDYENRAPRHDKYDTETEEYIYPEDEEDFDPETLDYENDVWGTIDITDNEVNIDHPQLVIGFATCVCFFT